MRFILTLLTAFVMAPFVMAQNYTLEKYVIGGGGGEMSSTNYSVNGTVGQPVIGPTSSTNYSIEAGFWSGAGPGTGGGCEYVVGDANGSSSYNGLDITFGVNFFKGGALPVCPDCPACNSFYFCGDVNASCSYNGLDITYGVSYFKGGSGPLPCGDCPPGGVVLFSIDPKPKPRDISRASTEKSVTAANKTTDKSRKAESKNGLK